MVSADHPFRSVELFNIERLHTWQNSVRFHDRLCGNAGSIGPFVDSPVFESDQGMGFSFY